MHRVDLQLSLYERAKQLGVQYLLGEKIDCIDVDAAELTTEPGHKAKADIIVAADGLWSKTAASFRGRKKLAAANWRPGISSGAEPEGRRG